MAMIHTKGPLYHVLRWVLPGGTGHSSTVRITPYTPGEPIERYGGEALWYQECSAHENVYAPPQFSDQGIVERGPKVYYGELVEDQLHFIKWYLAAEEYLKHLHADLYKQVMEEPSKVTLVKLRTDFYVRLQPGELIEPVDFGVITVTHAPGASPGWME